MPSKHCVVIVTLRPIPITHRGVPQKGLDELLQTMREVLTDILRQLFHALTLKHNPCTESRYYNVLCANGNVRCCKLVSAAWLADCPDCFNLHNLEWHIMFGANCTIDVNGGCVA